MGFFDRLFNSNKKPEETKSQTQPIVEEAVIIHFNYGLENLDEMYRLEDQLDKVIDDNKVGELDGHEIAVNLSDGFYYIYGPSAEIIYKTIKNLLVDTPWMSGATVKLRFGPPEPGVKEWIEEL